MKAVPEIPAWMTLVRTDERDTISWSNRRAPKDLFVAVFLVFFWLIWTPMTGFVFRLFISRLARGQGVDWFMVLWLVFGVAGVVLIPYTMLQRRWTEIIQVSDDSIIVGSRGWLAPRPVVKQKGEVELLALERHPPNDSDGETVFTLNLLTESGFFGGRRRMLAYWLPPAEKYRLFLILREIFERRGWSLRYRCTYEG